MAQGPDKENLPTHLSVWDTVSIIIGIVVGASIFETAPLIFTMLGGPWLLMSSWALGGLLALVGALCYAELASSYPHAGGDYVYLARAYGRWVGFLFGWAQLAVILSTNIGMMCFVFADYGARLFSLDKGWGWAWAGSAVLVLTFLNILGIRAGKTTQNLLTAAKVLGLGAIVLAGLFWPSSTSLVPTPNPDRTINLATAMIFIMFAYGGWNDAAYVAAEQRDGRRNIPRALVLGTAGIVLIYLLVNFAYLRGLGYDRASGSEAIAADVLARPLGAWGEKGMCLLVMISALGAANGLIFTGTRVALKLGKEHALFRWLGHWHARRGAPYVALLTLCAISLAMIAMVSIPAGQNFLNHLFSLLHLPEVNWVGKKGFDTLFASTAPVFWSFFLLTGLSLIILRFKDAGPLTQRPFSVPLYPLTPILFCATCGYMLYSSIDYGKWLALVGASILVVGVPIYFLSEWMEKTTPPLTPPLGEAGPEVALDQPSNAIQPDIRSVTERRENP
jgi:basic amino acid/polyamine antiporter, APA family